MTVGPHIDLADIRAALLEAFNKGAVDEGGRGYADLERDTLSLAGKMAHKLATNKTEGT